MQKLSLNQSLQQKLSPQQIQFIKLLQIPSMELDARIEEEMEVNPALEEGPEEEYNPQEENVDKEKNDDDVNLDEYLQHEDFAGYKMQGDGHDPNAEHKEIPVVAGTSLTENLLTQLGFLKYDERHGEIAKHLIGSIDSDGYIRRELEAIVNDLAFSANLDTDIDEVEETLYKIQEFDPPGIAARNLQECLLIQLERKDVEDPDVALAIKVIDEQFNEFTKKHYDKILKRLDITEDRLKAVNVIITRLNPKPGGSGPGGAQAQVLYPDFILEEENGKFNLSLNSKNAPELKVSRSYSDMFDAYSKSPTKDKKMKDTLTFVKQKLDSARWFIDAIKQRQTTLLRTMNAIVNHQYDFFLEGDESKLKPMILKDIAEKIEMDISTISRVANSKNVQTEFGIFPLKFFFSEGLTTESGEDVSSREVKNALKKIVDSEEKRKPLSDDKIVEVLKEQGYSIARRTVAKYREQLNIPVARLRKEL